MAVYGYARVSSRGQADGFGLDVQREKLLAAGAGEVREDVFTGTEMHRPAWDALMGELKAGDTLVVAKLDRIARTAAGGCEAVRSLVERGVSVRVLNMGLVEDTPVARFVNICKNVIRMVLHYCGIRRQQFWGWRRTREEYQELFHSSGYSRIQDGHLDDGFNTYWIRGE